MTSSAEAPVFKPTDKDGNPAVVGPRWVVNTTGNNRARRRRRAAVKRDMERLNKLLREHAILVDAVSQYALGGTDANIPASWVKPGQVVTAARLDARGVGLVARMLGKPFLAVKRAAVVCLHEVRRGH